MRSYQEEDSRGRRLWLVIPPARRSSPYFETINQLNRHGRWGPRQSNTQHHRHQQRQPRGQDHKHIAPAAAIACSPGRSLRASRDGNDRGARHVITPRVSGTKPALDIALCGVLRTLCGKQKTIVGRETIYMHEPYVYIPIYTSVLPASLPRFSLLLVPERRTRKKNKSE